MSKLERFAAPCDTPLNVPFDDKDRAKGLGARAKIESGKFLYWFIPKGTDVTPFKEWLPDELTQNLADTPATPTTAASAKGEEKGVALSWLLNEAGRALKSALPGRHWVRADILAVSGGKHIYLELVEYDSNGRELAKARASIWASNRKIVDRFETKTGLKLAAGTKVLLQLSVDFHPSFGFSLTCSDIDPSFSLGEMEQRLTEIRKTLTNEGIIGNNRALPLPGDFRRVAVIAPEGAAGLGDFMTQADILSAHGVCEFDLFGATFQGPTASGSVVAALSRVHAIAESDPGHFNACVIIRGGGDKAGLYALNDLAIARAVCNLPIPVLCGIGHERDNTIIDEVAALRLPTPSLTISHIVGTVVQNVRNAKAAMLELQRGAGALVHRARADAITFRDVLSRSVAQQVAEARAQADKQLTALKVSTADQLSGARALAKETRLAIDTAVKVQISKARDLAKSLMQAVLLQDPIKVLSRGYAVVRDATGRCLTRADDAQAGTDVILQFQDGQRSATLTESTPPE